MELALLDSAYNKTEVIETFHSCLWTEQYSDTGNFELVAPLTDEMYNSLSPGRHIANSESDEVGTILTRQVKDGAITVKGLFQLGLLKYRVYHGGNIDHEAQSQEYQGTPGQTINHIVYWSCVAGGPPTIPNQVVIPDTTEDNLVNFSIGDIDIAGDSVTQSLQYGQTLSSVLAIAQANSMGVRIRVDRPSPLSTPTLVFEAYYGENRSYDVVFDPALDTLANPEEFTSSASYFNVCYAYAPNIQQINLNDNIVIGYANNAAGLRNWDRRVMMLFVQDLDPDTYNGQWGMLENVLTQRAKDALANNNYIRLADGELVPQMGFQYGVDYNLGDVISLRGQFGTTQTARITEYIRSQDNTGYKEYPTLAII